MYLYYNNTEMIYKYFNLCIYYNVLINNKVKYLLVNDIFLVLERASNTTNQQYPE